MESDRSRHAGSRCEASSQGWALSPHRVTLEALLNAWKVPSSELANCLLEVVRTVVKNCDLAGLSGEAL